MAQDVDGASQFRAEAEGLTAEELNSEEQAAIKRMRADAARRAGKEPEPGPEVIEPDGTLVEDLGQYAARREDGTWVDARTGTEIEQDELGAWRVAKPWPHSTLEYKGDKWEYRQPKQLGAMFLGIASRKNASAKRKLDAIIGYLEHTLSPKSLDRMEERAFDHDDDFDAEHMGELVRLISTGGQDG